MFQLPLHFPSDQCLHCDSHLTYPKNKSSLTKWFIRHKRLKIILINEQKYFELIFFELKVYFFEDRNRGEKY